MKILPVIDLKGSQVVRGVGGQRASYQPVRSNLDCDATPRSVAKAFSRQLGFRSSYVADLDAISGDQPNWCAYDAIASAGLRMIVDAGMKNSEQATQSIDRWHASDWCDGIVVGLETLESEQDLRALFDAIGVAQAVFSLDLRGGSPLTTISDWAEADPIKLVEKVVSVGFQRVILLDLSSVGSGRGVSAQNLCNAVRIEFPNIEITSGGGVRSRRDLVKLSKSGCDLALVASALHNGQLTKEDVADF
ncbi:MAG: hypothetical protein H6822_17810 [Planctomycetaceae bacterium]|nr:hypothetical protein [Planctomycetales bacterium]MCB9924042.1 hypothetical protein [Planctomycetaceae bacterium]